MVFKKLAELQNEIKAPKSQYNKFGNYNYRNVEDIQSAVKPLLVKHGLSLTVSDELVMIGERYYIKATATITDGKESVSCTAYARESESKKGMDDSMCSGTASSYSRKYALGGLLLLDDQKDADGLHKTSKPDYKDFEKHKQFYLDKINEGESAQILIERLEEKYEVSESVKSMIKKLGEN